MPKLLSREFTKNLPEVTASSYFEKKRRYHRYGLFSEYIFGLENNYTCRCGTYHGKHAVGQVCNEKICDGLEITNSIKRRRQFAKIVLPESVIVLNRTFLSLMKKILPDSERDLFKHINTLMKSHRNILCELEDGDLSIRKLEDDESTSDIKGRFWQLQEAVDRLVKYYLNDLIAIYPDDEDLKMIYDNVDDHLFIYEVLVIPPALRPISQINPTTNSVDQINQYYYQLLVRKEIIANGDIDIREHMSVRQQYYFQIQKIVDDLHDHILSSIASKEGLIRGNMLGKRVDFSGRGVIAPEPTIGLDECILPYKMVLEFYKIKIADKLYKMGSFISTHLALEFIEECQFNNDPQLLSICREVIGDDVCILNRQPSLHKLSMLSFKILVSLADVIYIHPMVCHGFNADFDGDSIVSIINLTKENGSCITISIDELKDTDMFKLNPEKEKENISHYDPTEELTIKAISLEDGTIAQKKILDYSEHRNLKMYKIHDPKNRFEDFWVSDDHSLIIYDENVDNYLKISPIELLENPEGRYLIQQK